MRPVRRVADPVIVVVEVFFAAAATTVVVPALRTRKEADGVLGRHLADGEGLVRRPPTGGGGARRPAVPRWRRHRRHLLLLMHLLMPGGNDRRVLQVVRQGGVLGHPDRLRLLRDNGVGVLQVLLRMLLRTLLLGPAALRGAAATLGTRGRGPLPMRRRQRRLLLLLKRWRRLLLKPEGVRSGRHRPIGGVGRGRGSHVFAWAPEPSSSPSPSRIPLECRALSAATAPDGPRRG